MRWKDPPSDPKKTWVNTSMEIQILLNCNWACGACDQFSQLPSIAWIRKSLMSVEQIQALASEMRSTNSYLGRIRLVGGEPSMHPKLDAIVGILNGLKADDHLGQVEVITNGSNNNILRNLTNKIDKIRVSDENDKQKHHTANLANTPKSLGYAGTMCNAPWHCGISLNYYGYFPCSSGAGLARLMNDVPHWQRLKLPQRPILEEWPDLQELCNHCYHGLKKEDKVKCGTDLHHLNTPNPEMWSHLAPWLLSKSVPSDWQVVYQ